MELVAFVACMRRGTAATCSGTASPCSSPAWGGRLGAERHNARNPRDGFLIPEAKKTTRALSSGRSSARQDHREVIFGVGVCASYVEASSGKFGPDSFEPELRRDLDADLFT